MKRAVSYMNCKIIDKIEHMFYDWYTEQMFGFGVLIKCLEY